MGNTKEIEIKLYIAPDTIKALRSNHFFVNHAKEGWQRKELFNSYYDTPSHALTRAKAALRIRKDGEQFIQTLKMKGHSVSGFSERDEFSWELNKPELDLAVLDEKVGLANFSDFDKKQLIPIFATDFQRDQIIIDYATVYGSAKIEVALDEGLVKVKGAQEVISELELELKAGSVDVLLEFAILLAQQYPLIPINSSKAERGYHLADSLRYPLITATSIASDNDNLTELIQMHLARGQQLFESCFKQFDLNTLKQWYVELTALATLFKQCAIEITLVISLQRMIEDWQPFLSQVTADTIVINERFNGELNNTRWGVFSLSTSRWLLNHH